MAGRLVLFMGFVALAAAQAPEDPTFVVGPGGVLFPTAPGGYVVASLRDAQSKEFRDYYNPFGLQSSSGGFTPGTSHCSMIAVREGLLAYGPPSNTTVVGPYDDNGQWQTGDTLSSPVWLGGAGGNADLGPVNASFQASFYTVPAAADAGYCSAPAVWTLYRRAQFNFGRTGASYPEPSDVAVLASLADIKSPQFVYQYNERGLTGLPYPSGSPNGCCAVRVEEGYLTYRVSRDRVGYLVPHFGTGDGTSACDGSGFARFDGPQRFVTRFDDGYRAFFHTLNFTTLRDINVTRDGPKECSDQPRNSFAVAKQAPSAASGMGNCWQVELQYGTYTPTGGACMADRFRFNTTNASTHTVALNSFNTCGGSYFVYDFEISTYNEQYASVSMSSITACAGCNATGKLIPVVTGTEMSTICEMTLGEVGWCNFVMSIRANYDCPTPSPRLNDDH